MNIFQIDTRISAMSKNDIEQELGVIGDVLAAVGGELIGAEVRANPRHQVTYLMIYVRAESELMVSDIFECSYFSMGRISCLNSAADILTDFKQPANAGQWQYQPAALVKSMSTRPSGRTVSVYPRCRMAAMAA
jgi:hypothetical protein